MKTVAIIAEYNPFHNGHKYQIDKIHEILGDDIAIVAIMSGNYTQRGELAIADKSVRAKAAVLCGVDLVLEMPFPFSSSSAEFFARSGVKIANEIGADYLVFGSESGDISELTKIADLMLSDEFNEIFKKNLEDERYKNYGYAKLLEVAYNQLNENNNFDFYGANNILALEYIKAIRYWDSKIIPLTIKREENDYKSDKIDESKRMQSASALRTQLYESQDTALKYMPNIAFNEFLLAQNEGMAPASIETINSAIISHFRLNSPSNIKIHDCDDGLYKRLCALSMRTNSISSLATLAETKKYTNSRIRRAILYSFFGVTSSIVKEYPLYTQVLAMNGIGRQVLKRIKKGDGFRCITKPADFKMCSDDVISQKELSNKADSIYALALPGNIFGAFSLTFTPFVKK